MVVTKIRRLDKRAQDRDRETKRERERERERQRDREREKGEQSRGLKKIINSH